MKILNITIMSFIIKCETIYKVLSVQTKGIYIFHQQIVHDGYRTKRPIKIREKAEFHKCILILRLGC